MKIETINGKVEVINETFAESFTVFNEILESFGAQPISEKIATSDFGIIGGETNAQLDEWARDYVSELHTEKCAAKNEWRYNH